MELKILRFVVDHSVQIFFLLGRMPRFRQLIAKVYPTANISLKKKKRKQFLVRHGYGMTVSLSQETRNK